MKKEFKITLDNGEVIDVTFTPDYLKNVHWFEFRTKEPNSISHTGYKSHFEQDETLMGLSPEEYARQVGNHLLAENKPKRKKK